MEYKLNITSVAKRNIDNAVEFYDARSKKVAKKFLKTLEKHFCDILKNPYYAIRYDDVRTLPLRDFPYIILFRIRKEDKSIDILSVFCTHQNPEKYP